MLAVSVATNLLATAIWEFAIAPLYRGAKKLRRPPGGRGRSLLDDAVRRAAADLSGVTRDSGIKREAWGSFVSSPEVAAVVNDVFRFRMDESDPSLADIQTAFEGLWRAHLADRELTSSYDISHFFDELVDVCNNVLDSAIAENVLAAHEAKSAARHKAVLARLDGIAAAAPDQPLLTQDELRAFENELAEAVRLRHSTIQPPNVFEKERVPIDTLYVAPSFSESPSASETPSQEESADLREIVAGISRRVVLGHPGAGKSTLTAKLCKELASPGSELRLSGRSVTPWPIELRRYADAKSRRVLSLVDYFEEWAQTSYLISCRQGTFVRALEAGRLLVIFDGLDELLDTSQRVAIRDEVESFCARFPFTPVLITSRKVGYGQAPLDHDLFDVVQLLDFDESRVRAYAERWFNHQLVTEPLLTRQERTQHFLRESKVADDLRRSPLLLALLCSSYRGAGFIPKNLPDVYDNCATLLFSTWDKQRHIDVLLPFAEHVRPALRDLAWWLFTTVGSESTVTKRQAVERATEYLNRRRFSDADEARAAAEEFIEFCRGRAWVFTDQGTTTTGEPLFGFTHRTFLEFFAAEHLAYRRESTQELVEGLKDRVVAQEWDVVAQIALQIKARSYPDGADDVLKALYNGIRKMPNAKLLTGFEFVLRFMRAVVPSPLLSQRISGNLAAVAIRLWLADDAERARQLLAGLASVGPELSTEGAKGVAKAVEEMFSQSGFRVKRAGAELLEFSEEIGVATDETSRLFWGRVREIVTRDGQAIAAAAMEDQDVATDCYFSVSIGDELLAQHGPILLLRRTELLLERRSLPSVAVRGLSQWRQAGGRDQARRLLQLLGGLVGDPRMERLAAPKEWQGDPGMFQAVGELPADLRLAPVELAGLWLLAAASLEWTLAVHRRSRPDLRALHESRSADARLIGEILSLSLGPGVDHVRALVSDGQLEEPALGRISRWVGGSARLLNS